MSDSDTFWVAARAPKYPHHPALRHLQTALNRPQPEQPSSDTADPIGTEAVADLSLTEYAQVRDQLGLRATGEFVGLDSPQPRPALTADEMVALGLGYGAHENTGFVPRPRGIDITGHTSIGGHPFRGAAIENGE